MAFFDKLQEVAKTIGEKTTETVKVVGDMTSEAVEITKQKAKISQEKSAILDLKKQIGEIIWNRYVQNQEMDEEIAARCEAIKEHCAQISACEEEINNIKGRTASVNEAPEEKEPCTEAADECSGACAEEKTECADEFTQE